MFSLAILTASWFGAARAEVVAPGSAMWPPREVAPSAKAVPRALQAAIEAEGLYSYFTPFAPQRWLRLQQSGSILWGTIDINDSFGMCTRARLDGTVSGSVVSFVVPLHQTACPCSGPGATLSFVGTVNSADSTISGTWTNNCTPPPPGSWAACRVPEPVSGGTSMECLLPENAPPPVVRQTPAGGVVTWSLLACGLAVLAFGRLRARAMPADGRMA